MFDITSILRNNYFSARLYPTWSIIDVLPGNDTLLLIHFYNGQDVLPKSQWRLIINANARLGFRLSEN